MGIITAIKPQKRARDRVNVYIDGEFAIGLFTTTAVDAGLQVGQELDNESIEAIEQREELTAVKERIFRLLSHRPRSTQEVRLRLRQAGIESNVAEHAIAELEEKEHLDDEQFAQFWVDNRMSNRPRGAMLLRAELRQKGVDTAVIETVLAETDLDELDTARQFAASKIGSMRDLDEQTLRRRLGGQLSRKGYSWDIVRQVIDELLSEDSESSQTPVV